MPRNANCPAGCNRSFGPSGPTTASPHYRMYICRAAPLLTHRWALAARNCRKLRAQIRQSSVLLTIHRRKRQSSVLLQIHPPTVQVYAQSPPQIRQSSVLSVLVTILRWVPITAANAKAVSCSNTLLHTARPPRPAPLTLLPHYTPLPSSRGSRCGAAGLWGCAAGRCATSATRAPLVRRPCRTPLLRYQSPPQTRQSSVLLITAANAKAVSCSKPILPQCRFTPKHRRKYARAV